MTQRLPVVEADPDADGELRHVADEPGVAVAVGGAGLAGHRAQEALGAHAGAGAAIHDALEHRGHEVGLRRIESVAAGADVPLEHVSGGVLHSDHVAQLRAPALGREYGTDRRDCPAARLLRESPSKEGCPL